MPLPEETRTDSKAETAANETVEALSHLNLKIEAEAEPEGSLKRKRAQTSLVAAETSEARKKARPLLQAAETTSVASPPEDELESSSGSIKDNIKKNREVLDKYLRYSGTIEDKCDAREIFSKKEKHVIHAEPGESTRGVKCLDILLTKEEPVLKNFIEVLKEVNCEHVASLFEGPLAPDLRRTIQTQERYEKAIYPHDLELLRVIDSLMQKEGVAVFIRELQRASVIKVDSRWEALVRGRSRLAQAIAVYNKVDEQFGLERLVDHFLRDLELQSDQNTFLAIKASAESSELDSLASLEASPASGVTREGVIAIFPELVRRLNIDGLVGHCSRGIFSKAKLERIAAKSSRSNRTRAFLVDLLETDQPAKLKEFAEMLKILGYRGLAGCLSGDSEMIDKLQIERRTKELVNQHYLKVIKLLAREMQAGFGWPVGARAELTRFCCELGELSIIKLSEGWEVEELAKLPPCERADWVIARSWEQLKLGELIGFLKRKLEARLGEGAQSSPDANLVEGLELVSRIINQAELEEASLSSDTRSSDEEMSSDMSLLEGILNKIDQAVAKKEGVIQEKEAELKASQERIDRAQEKLEQARQTTSTAEEVRKAEEELETEKQTQKDLTKFYRKQEGSADEHIFESVSIFERIDRGHFFDGYVRCDGSSLKASQDLLLMSRWDPSVFASRFTKITKDAAELRILCDAFKKSDQIKMMRESQDTEREKSREEACEALRRKRDGLVDSIRPSKPLLRRSCLVGLITEDDCEGLLSLLQNGEPDDAIREFLDRVELRCSDDFIKKLGACLQEDCQPLAVSHLMYANYKDERAERFNQNWERLPNDVIETVGGLCRASYLQILEELAYGGTISLWQAEKLVSNDPAETSCDRVRNLKKMFLGFNFGQVYNGWLAIQASCPKLAEILATDDIKAFFQANQNPTQLVLTSFLCYLASGAASPFFSRSTTAEPMQTEESAEEGPEKEVYTLSKT